MEKNQRRICFLIIGLCILVMYITSLYEILFVQGSVSSHDILFCIILTLLAIASLVGCIYTSHRIANNDTLTGIGNVDYIMVKGGKLHFQKKLIHYTAIFLNMKDCKYINEIFGNKAVDNIIHDYAQTLKRWLVGKGYVGRMGGDNFYIYVKNENLDEFLEFLRNIILPVRREDEVIEYKVKVRCGITRITNNISYRDIINHCSTALAIAKAGGPDFVEYDISMQKKFIEEKQILLDFNEALKCDYQLVPYYQPKVDAKTKKLCGAEALVRWFKDDRIIMPDKFIPALEINNKISKLDFYIFEQMCKDLRGWIDAGIPTVRISSNFSIKNLKNENFAEEIIAIVNKYKLDGRYIEVELTESSCMEDFKLLKAFSKKVKKAGIKLAIDDFGTGYSSLSLLNEFDADIVKLDKSFLDSAIAGNDRSKVFIKDVIYMVKDLEKTTLCEGVETVEQLEFLKSSGCNIIQGYYFDKPLAKKDFEKRLMEPQYN